MQDLPQLSEQQLKDKAFECDRALTRTLYELLLLLTEIHNYKLYLYMDDPFQSFEEYCAYKWGYARSTTLLYMEIAKKFLPFYKNEEVQHVGLFALGVVKLDILGSLDTETLAKLSGTGEIELGGNIYTIQDLKAMDREKLRSLINGQDEETKKQSPEKPEIPFDVAYSKAEKWFTNILNTVYQCPTILVPDQEELQILIYKATLIFDKYKEGIKTTKKIKVK